MNIPFRYAWLLAGSILLSPTLAIAQEAEAEIAEESVDDPKPAPDPAPSEKPWAKGVSRGDQAEALKLFRTGNKSFVERDFKTALAHYKEALEHWKHPAIHFNVAVCQVNLEKPLEAYENITAAVAYGAAPLGEEGFTQASTYEKLLEGRLGRLEVTSAQPGITVSANGEQVLAGPGSAKQILLPGELEVVAKADGYVTSVRRIQVYAGQTTTVVLNLIQVGEQVYERPMDSWIPWTVTGAGAAVVGAGVALRLMATRELNSYGDEFSEACPDGCAESEIPDDLQSTRQRARLLDGSAIAAWSIGGAAVVTGVSLLIYNQPRPVTPEDSARLKWTPLIGRSSAGLLVGGSF